MSHEEWAASLEENYKPWLAKIDEEGGEAPGGAPEEEGEGGEAAEIRWFEPEAEELLWLRTEWSSLALQHQLRQLGQADAAATATAAEASPARRRSSTAGAPPPPLEPTRQQSCGSVLRATQTERAELAKLLWAELQRRGVGLADGRKIALGDRATALDSLGLPPDQKAAAAKTEHALLWLECVLGVPVGRAGGEAGGAPSTAAGGAVHEALRSGEALCDLVNRTPAHASNPSAAEIVSAHSDAHTVGPHAGTGIQPGIVPSITRAAKSEGMSKMRLAAKQRDNITRYLEARLAPTPTPTSTPAPGPWAPSPGA